MNVPESIEGPTKQPLDNGLGVAVAWGRTGGRHWLDLGLVKGVQE